ncbi:LacI family DNA-binding transcriptional regulator, partial [Nonomuraea sp. NPDC004186]
MSSIKEVARLAGVSVGTVSNVLNRPDMVAPDTRLRVRAAIARLGYVRNGSARQLRAGHSRTIGVVALDLANPFFIDVLRGVDRRAVVPLGRWRRRIRRRPGDRVLPAPALG